MRIYIFRNLEDLRNRHPAPYITERAPRVAINSAYGLIGTEPSSEAVTVLKVKISSIFPVYPS